VAVRAAFVAMSVMVTVTSGTTAPLWSVTRPTIVPCEPVCPHAGKAAQHNSSVEITAKKDNPRTLFMSSPHVEVADFVVCELLCNANVRVNFTQSPKQLVV